MEMDEEEIMHVSPPKQTRTDTFQSAFSNLKNSEFFKEELPSTSKVGQSKTKISSSLLVSPKQKGNALLKFILNIPWEYSDIVPDYVMGSKTCALFLSIRYHQLNPDYIHERLKLLGNAFSLRVLLVQVDIPDPLHALKHLTRICILADMTLMLAWNAEEAGKIIETYKSFENKPPDMIMDRSDTAPYQKLISALTSVRSINKTDATTLLSNFGTMEGIVNASSDKLSLCQGFGIQKAQRLHQVLHEPFLKRDKIMKKN